jgi:hypothetical protein
VKNQALLTTAVLVALVSFASAGQHTDSKKDIFLNEKGCPLVSVLPVTGGGYELKNVGRKTITSYTLACFRKNGKKHRVDAVLNYSERENVLPGKTTGWDGFDATPPNVCRERNALLGVYAVKFSDGSFWMTAASR